MLRKLKYLLSLLSLISTLLASDALASPKIISVCLATNDAVVAPGCFYIRNFLSGCGYTVITADINSTENISGAFTELNLYPSSVPAILMGHGNVCLNSQSFSELAFQGVKDKDRPFELLLGTNDSISGAGLVSALSLSCNNDRRPFFLESCHSGALIKDKYNLTNSFLGPIMTSCDADTPSATESEFPVSNVTKKYLDLLCEVIQPESNNLFSEHDLNDDNVLDKSELRNYFGSQLNFELKEKDSLPVLKNKKEVATTEQISEFKEECTNQGNRSERRIEKSLCNFEAIMNDGKKERWSVALSPNGTDDFWQASMKHGGYLECLDKDNCSLAWPQPDNQKICNQILAFLFIQHLNQQASPAAVSSFSNLGIGAKQTDDAGSRYESCLCPSGQCTTCKVKFEISDAKEICGEVDQEKSRLRCRNSIGWEQFPVLNDQMKVDKQAILSTNEFSLPEPPPEMPPGANEPAPPPVENDPAPAPPPVDREPAPPPPPPGT